MTDQKSPLVTFTRKLREHQVFSGKPNKKMIFLIYRGQQLTTYGSIH
jgi:hypothetical protein